MSVTSIRYVLLLTCSLLLLAMTLLACGAEDTEDERESEQESRSETSSPSEADSRVLWGRDSTPQAEESEEESVSAPEPTRRGLLGGSIVRNREEPGPTAAPASPTRRPVPTARPTATARPPTATPVPEGWVLTQSEAVHRAAYSGDVADVVRLLEQGVDTSVQASIRNGQLEIEGHRLTPLHLAVAFNSNVEVAEQLMEWGSNVEAHDYHGRTPLHWAAWNAEPASVEQLLEWGANAEAGANDPYNNSRYWRPLHFAVAHNADTAVAALLLEWGADITATDGYNATPLHRAVQYNPNPDIVDLLLEWGANLEGLDGNQQTPLHYAALNRNPAMAALLLDRGANIEAMGYANRTPLHQAVLNLAHQEAAASVVKLLLDRGANIEAQDSNGRTPLLLVTQEYQNLRDSTGESIVGDTAAEMIELLLDNEADIETQQNGWTPLLWAAYHDQPEIAELLLDRGADSKATNSNGQTPCQIARQRGSFTGTRLLGDLCRP